MDDGSKSLEETIALALGQQGVRVFQVSDVLVGYALDFLEPDSIELRVLLRYCTRDLLQPYADFLLSATNRDLDFAVARARAYLADECSVDRQAAEVVTCDIARGIVLWQNKHNSSLTSTVERAGVHDDSSTGSDTDAGSGADFSITEAMAETDRARAHEVSPGDTNDDARRAHGKAQTKARRHIPRLRPIAVACLVIVCAAVAFLAFGQTHQSNTASAHGDQSVLQSSKDAEDKSAEKSASDGKSEESGKPATVTVRFYDEKDGKVVKTKDVEAGTEVRIPDLERKDSVLERWDFEGNTAYGLKSGDKVTASEDMDVYAIWKDLIEAPKGITVELVTSSDSRTVRKVPADAFDSDEQAVILVHNESNRDRELYVRPGRLHSLLGKTYVIGAGQSGVLLSDAADSYEVHDFDPNDTPNDVFYDSREEGAVIERRDYKLSVREVEVGKGVLNVELSNLEQLGETSFEFGVLGTKDDEVVFCDGSINYPGSGDVWTVHLGDGGNDVNWEDYERRYFVEAQFV